MPVTQRLLEAIQALPPERIAKVEDFVAFITAQEQERSVTHAAAAASTPAFAAIWDNPEDAAYEIRSIWTLCPGAALSSIGRSIRIIR